MCEGGKRPITEAFWESRVVVGNTAGSCAERPRGRELQALSNTEGSRRHTKFNCRIGGSEHSGVVPLD